MRDVLFALAAGAVAAACVWVALSVLEAREERRWVRWWMGKGKGE